MATKETVKSAVEDSGEKIVTIFIPKERDTQPPFYVSVNNQEWSLERGKTHSVPDYVAEVIIRSMEAEAEKTGPVRIVNS